MILTVTPNPSLDRTLHVPALLRGAVHRAVGESVEPSGKGVNVALAIQRAGDEGVEVLAVLPSGGHTGAHLAGLLTAAGLRHELVAVAGETRSNVSLVEPDGTTTKVNESGPPLGAADVARLGEAVQRLSAPGDWVAWCGSLPAGFAPSELAAQVRAAREAGRKVALDSSGEALAIALAGPPDGLPHLIKPNADELAELTGRPLRTLGDVSDAAAELVQRGVETVLVSLGADGAVLAERGTLLHGHVAAERVANTAGAGDAFLAGYLVAGPVAAGNRLASALRFGAAAVAQPGTLFIPPKDERPATIGVPDRATPLA